MDTHITPTNGSPSETKIVINGELMTPEEKVIATAFNLVFMPRFIPLLVEFIIKHDKKMDYVRAYREVSGQTISLEPTELDITSASVALVKSLGVILKSNP